MRQAPPCLLALWQRHTLRAAISTQLRKRGLEVVSRRENGTTVYAIINRAVDAADHVMAGIDAETAGYLRRRAAYFAGRDPRALRPGERAA